MWRTICIVVIGSIVIISIRVALQSITPFAWRLTINLPLMVCVFMIFLDFRLSSILGIALATSFLLETWSSIFFGALMLTLLATLALTYALFHYVVTNRSLPALLILGAAATIAYRIILGFFYAVSLLTTSHALALSLTDGLTRTLHELATHSAALSFSFIVTRGVSKRLHTHYVHSA